MNSRWVKLVGLVGTALVAAVSLPACAAEGDDDPVVDESAADLTARQLPNVAAVEVTGLQFNGVTSTKTIGAPKKVKKLVATPKKLRANAAIPRCIAPTRTQLTYLDAAGKKLATLTMNCFDYGRIRFENGSADYMVSLDPQVVTEVTAAPFAVGDALWGITKIAIHKPTRAGSEKTLTGDQLKPILDGFDLDAVPDAGTSAPGCGPGYMISFERADVEVASSWFLCHDFEPAPPPAFVQARFQASDLPGVSLTNGGFIPLDPRPLFRLYASSN